MTTRPPLAAATPADWLERHLSAMFADLGSPPLQPADTWLTRAALLAHDAHEVRAMFARRCADRLPPQTSATFVAAFVGGPLAGAIGFVLAGTGAGVVVDPERTRWRLHPDGFIDRVELAGATFLVDPDHPWAGLPEVEVVDDDWERVERTMGSLVATMEPLIEACHSLARVGRAGLWNEVADAFGLSIVYQHVLPAREDVVEMLGRALRSTGSPWRARPRLGLAVGSFGSAYTGQKGGCCLAYLQHEREAGGPRRYCSTCALRDPDDARSLQLAYFERTRPGGSSELLDRRGWPIVIITAAGRVDLGTVQRFCAELDVLLGQGDTFGLVLDMGGWSRDARTAIGEWLERRFVEIGQVVAAMATVVPSAAVDSNRQYIDEHPDAYPCPTHVAASRLECARWVGARLGKDA
ncbi:MAG: hypothetical protein AB7R77_24825 [Ilumatobacteraceae bacterium]